MSGESNVITGNAIGGAGVPGCPPAPGAGFNRRARRFSRARIVAPCFAMFSLPPV